MDSVNLEEVRNRAINLIVNIDFPADTAVIFTRTADTDKFIEIRRNSLYSHVFHTSGL